MKKINKILHICIPFLWIIVFFLTKYDVADLDYGSIHTFMWFALPIIMFVFNTFVEKKIKRLTLIYLISTVIQTLVLMIYLNFYYKFIASDPGTLAIGQLSVFITVILNIIISLIGIIIKSIVYKLKKNK